MALIDLGDLLMIRTSLLKANHLNGFLEKNLSTLMSLTLFSKACSCFHDIWIFDAPMGRMLVVYILVFKFLLGWRIIILVRILEWTIGEDDVELKVFLNGLELALFHE